MSPSGNSKRPERDATDPQAVERTAVGLLARREHSRAELQHKLVERGFDRGAVESVLDQLQAKRLQSDERYVESYIAARSGRGFGPQRIRAELRERGIGGELAEHGLAVLTAGRREHLKDVWHKKFGGRWPADYQEQTRQMRFLQQRGFSAEDIRDLFAGSESFD